MGLFGTIAGFGKKLLGGGGGGGGPIGYSSPYTKEYEEKAKDKIYSNMSQPDKKFSGVDAFNEAQKPYDFSGLNSAISSYKNMGSYRPSTYGASQYNFSGLPQQYGDLAYASGSKDIKRQGNSNLESLKETVGPRRLGLLAKLSGNQARDTGENLAKLRSDIDLDVMNKNVDLGKEQQLQQAVENYKATGFNADEAYKKATFDQQNAQGLADLEKSKLGLQSNVVGQQADLASAEKNYNNMDLDRLIDLFTKTAGLGADASKAGAANQQGKQGQTLQSLASLAGLFL